MLDEGISFQAIANPTVIASVERHKPLISLYACAKLYQILGRKHQRRRELIKTSINVINQSVLVTRMLKIVKTKNRNPITPNSTSAVFVQVVTSSFSVS